MEESRYQERAKELHEAQMAEALDVRARRATEEIRREERMATDRQCEKREEKKMEVYVADFAHLKAHRDRSAEGYEAMVKAQERQADALEKQAEALNLIAQGMPRR